MENFETPHEDDALNEFIECTVCQKSMRGKTLYKIHLTSPGHIKKEDAIVAAGLGVREHALPVFEDILQYLDYLDIDEPIIGLSYLEELPCNLADPLIGPRYACRLCNYTANLPEIVHHVIGRKHRQKYVEENRPDLVIWDKPFMVTQVGKIIRARAGMIERQDGRGCPVAMKKKGGIGWSNTSRVPPPQKQNLNQNTNMSSGQCDFLPPIREIKDYQKGFSLRERYLNTSRFSPDDGQMLNTDKPMYPRDDMHSCDPTDEEFGMLDDGASYMYREQHRDSDYPDEYEDKYFGDTQTRGDVPPYGSREGMSCGQNQSTEYSTDETPYRTHYPDKDPLKEFYMEEVRRGQVNSAERESSQLRYPEENRQRWSVERESGRPRSSNRIRRHGSDEPKAKRRNIPSLLELDQSHQRFPIRDYQHEAGEPDPEEFIIKPGPGRTGSSPFQTANEAPTIMSDIPEPFRRFLKGAVKDEREGKRKRKSHFCDLTTREMATTNKTLNDAQGSLNPRFRCHTRPIECVPPNPRLGHYPRGNEHGHVNPNLDGHPGPNRRGSQNSRFGAHSRQGGASFEPEVPRVDHHPVLYSESECSNQSEMNQGGGSDSGCLHDILKNIEIENAEEAKFLKNRLCSLLKEFKAKKAEKIAQNNQSYGARDYNNSKPDRQLFERTVGEDSDIRQRDDPHFGNDLRGRSWKQHDRSPDADHQDYLHLACEESRLSNRGRYEETFIPPERFREPHAIHPDEEADPETFQEPTWPHVYGPDEDEIFDSQPFAPSQNMESGMHRGPRFISSLDKITSTLLELVARKSF